MELDHIKCSIKSILEVNFMAKEPEQMATDDAILLKFLTLVEEEGIEVAVTLNVKGVVISGLLVGASAYYEGITESSKQLSDSTMSKIMSKKLNNLKEAYFKQKQEESDKDEQENAPTFIHLKNANYLNRDDQTFPSRSSTWWRGRISSLDGFSFDFTD